MERIASGGSKRREGAVLALSIGSAAALAWVAIAAVQGSEVAGEFALQRRAGEVTDAVRAEWERLLDESRSPAPAHGDVFHWTIDEAPAPRAAHRNPRRAEREGPSVLATLLSEAERLELIEGQPEAALEAVLEGLASDPDPAHLPEARLRAIQLGAQLSRPEVAREQWDALRVEVEWDLPRGDTSYRLLAALAGSSVWPVDQRGDLQRAILEAWATGEIALPVEEPRLVLAPDGARVQNNARAAGLRARVRALAVSEVADAALRELERRERFAALLDLLGDRPRVPGGERWHVTETVLGPFVAHAQDEGLMQGFFTTHTDLAQKLESQLRLPDGFAIDFEGDADALGVQVRAATELPGTAMAFSLRHRDPQRIVRGARERAGFLRVALLVLAAFSGAAGIATFRAMRHQRRLADLKTGFIAGVSHDLRTPLASILLMAENLESGRVSGERAPRYYGAIRREADRLRRLVDDVLDFSRIERGQRAKLCIEEVDLAAFLDDVAHEAHLKVDAAGVTFVADVDGVRGEGALDTDAVRRALWNLIDNALAHSGSDTITLRAELRAPARLVLAVVDAGHGVPADMREEVFRAFAQLAGPGTGTGTGTKSSGGSGLGLAIVREIARSHGGDARALEGTGGVGTTFEMDLDLSGPRASTEDDD